MPEFFALSIILLLSFLLRLFFLTIHSTDNDGHIWKIKAISNSGRLFDFSHSVSDSLAEGWHAYPCLQHCLVSLFPRRYWLLSGKLLNFIYDMIAVLYIYLLSRYWLMPGYAGLHPGPLSAPSIVALLYATSPALFSATGRLKTIGGRVLGSLFGLLYFGTFGYAFLYNSYAAYFLCGLFTILSVLSSQFGIQTILLFSFLLSCFYLSPIPIGLVIGALLIGSSIPRLGIRRFLITRWEFYKMYWNISKKGTTATGRNSLKEIILLPIYLATNFRRFLGLCFKRITPIIAMVSAPALLLWIYWFVVSPAQVKGLIISTPESVYISYLCAAGIILFIITSIRPFTALGEAERYLGYSVGFLYILTVQYIYKNNIGFDIVFWLVMIHIIGISLNYLYMQLPSIDQVIRYPSNPQFWALIHYLKRQKGLRIVVLPTKESYKISSFLEKSDARFYYDYLSLRDRGMDYMLDEKAYYRMIKEDLGYFKKKYGINTFIAKQGYLSAAASKGINYDLRENKKVFRNDEYEVYQL